MVQIKVKIRVYIRVKTSPPQAPKFFWEVPQMAGGGPKLRFWGVEPPPPRLSQNFAGLLGKKQIHLRGGFLLAGIRITSLGKFGFDVYRSLRRT